MLLLLVFVGSFSATKSVYAASPITLDGLGAFSSCGVFMNNVRPCDTQLLTTAHGHDIIILVIVDSSCCNTNETVSSIIDSSGLVFTPRIAYSTYAKVWEYYARTTSPLNSDNITVVYSDFAWFGIQVIAIHGANNRSIFDQNPSIPGTVSCRGPTCSASIQTSTLDFVIASVAINDADSCEYSIGGPQPPQGFTPVAYTGKMEVEYSITATPQSNVAFHCNYDDAMAIVLDAISFYGAFGT